MKTNKEIAEKFKESYEHRHAFTFDGLADWWLSQRKEDIEAIVEMIKSEYDDNPQYGGMLNFASNITNEGSEIEKIISAFNYGFRTGWKCRHEEIISSLKEKLVGEKL